MVEKGQWLRGDFLGVDIPADIDALLLGGVDFLNRAMSAAGTLEDGNAIVGIAGCEPCLGGSTGQKVILELEFSRLPEAMDRRIFVKFSRDFSDPIRDAAKTQLEAEVKLGLLSNSPDFPIAVPRCYFADYHLASGTGMIINQCIGFGQDGIEPLYEKCLDYAIPQVLAHYQTIIKALAQLAGAQKSGKLAAAEALFPYRPEAQSFAAPIRYTEAQLQRRLEKLVDFAKAYPQLLPAKFTQPECIELLRNSLPHILSQERRIKAQLSQAGDYIALMHWNANIDNAWFWSDKAGQLRCGLMDWGGVSQMNIGLALWGALSAAESQMWEQDLDNLLALFIDEYRRAGGPQLEQKRLKQHLVYSAVVMGLSWLMDAPALILREIPNLAMVKDRCDPRFSRCESARTQLQMLINFLNLWQIFISEVS